MSFTALRKFVAPETIFGVGAVDLAGQYASKFGISKPLVVTDPGVMAAGWGDRVMESLAAFDIEGVFFSAITPNPKTSGGARWKGCSQQDGQSGRWIFRAMPWRHRARRSGQSVCTAL